jgi:3-dehydroquinate synthase
MKSIQVNAERSYSVNLDVDFKEQIEALSIDRERVAIFFSAKMREQIPQFSSGGTEYFYFPIPDGEAGKASTVLSQAWDWLGAAGFTRSDLLIGIGGGAITDFSGFLAATWSRGIDWIAVPTTVAGMVDAAIGGKTGINSDYGKNLIGAFHSPITVIIDASWLSTLSRRDFAAGLAEVVKTGFISDPSILNLLADKSLDDVIASRDLTLSLIEKSITVKAAVVSGDFKESFDREILNYGHTFGHAVELISKYSLRHGECVSIGMIFISNLLEQLGIMTSELRNRHLHLLQKLELPITYGNAEWPELLAAMKLDKKNRNGSLRFVAVSEPGKTQRLENPIESEMVKAYERLRS